MGRDLGAAPAPPRPWAGTPPTTGQENGIRIQNQLRCAMNLLFFGSKLCGRQVISPFLAVALFHCQTTTPKSPRPRIPGSVPAQAGHWDSARCPCQGRAGTGGALRPLQPKPLWNPVTSGEPGREEQEAGESSHYFSPFLADQVGRAPPFPGDPSWRLQVALIHPLGEQHQHQHTQSLWFAVSIAILLLLTIFFL